MILKLFYLIILKKQPFLHSRFLRITSDSHLGGRFCQLRRGQSDQYKITKGIYLNSFIGDSEMALTVVGWWWRGRVGGHCSEGA